MSGGKRSWDVHIKVRSCLNETNELMPDVKNKLMETVREIITLSSSRHCGTFILKFNKFKSVKKQIWFVVFSVFY